MNAAGTSTFREVVTSIESRAARVLRALARLVRDSRAREALEFMASEEERHIVVLGDLAGELPWSIELESAVQAAREAGRPFPRNSTAHRTLVTGGSEEAVLAFVRELERESIAMYRELAHHVRDPELRRRILAIVVEESEHLETVQALELIARQGPAAFFADAETVRRSLLEEMERSPPPSSG